MRVGWIVSVSVALHCVPTGAAAQEGRTPEQRQILAAIERLLVRLDARLLDAP